MAESEKETLYDEFEYSSSDSEYKDCEDIPGASLYSVFKGFHVAEKYREAIDVPPEVKEIRQANAQASIEEDAPYIELSTEILDIENADKHQPACQFMHDLSDHDSSSEDNFTTKVEQSEKYLDGLNESWETKSGRLDADLSAYLERGLDPMEGEPYTLSADTEQESVDYENVSQMSDHHADNTLHNSETCEPASEHTIEDILPVHSHCAKDDGPSKEGNQLSVDDTDADEAEDSNHLVESHTNQHIETFRSMSSSVETADLGWSCIETKTEDGNVPQSDFQTEELDESSSSISVISSNDDSITMKDEDAYVPIKDDESNFQIQDQQPVSDVEDTNEDEPFLSVTEDERPPTLPPKSLVVMEELKSLAYSEESEPMSHVTKQSEAKPKITQRKPKESETYERGTPKKEIKKEPKIPVKEVVQDTSTHYIFMNILNPPFADCVSQTIMQNYLDIDLKDIVFNYSRTCAVFSTKGKPDMERLKQKVKDKILSGTKFEVRLIDRPCSVAISSEAGLEIGESLELYLESSRNHGGDLDLQQQIFETDDGSCIVATFKDPKVANAFSEKKDHVLNNKPLVVTLFFRCDWGDVWDPDLHKVVLPEPITIPLTDNTKKLLQRSACMTFILELESKSCCCEFTDEGLKITCTLNRTTTNIKTRKAKWLGEVAKFVENFIKHELEHYDLDCSAQIWKDMKTLCKKYEHEEKVAVCCNDKTKLIEIDSLKGCGQDVNHNLLCQAKDLERKLRRTSECIQLKELHIRLMGKLGTFESMKETDLNVYLGEDTVTMEGQPDDITNMQKNILETRNHMQHVNLNQCLSEQCLRVIKEKKALCDKLDESFKKENIEAVWKVEGSSIQCAYVEDAMHSSQYEYEDVETAATIRKIFTSNVTEKSISFLVTDYSIITTFEFLEISKDLTEENDTLAEWYTDEAHLKIHFFGWKPNVEKMVSDMNTLMDKKITREVVIQPSDAEYNFIQKQKQDLIKRMEQTLEKESGSLRLLVGAAIGHHQEDLGELEANADVLVQTLQLLNEEIKDQDDKSLLKEIVSRIACESVREKNYYVFKEYTRRFKDRLGLRGIFSINTTEDIFNILVEIWENPKFATYVMKKVYNEDVSGIPIGKEISDKLPKDVQQLDVKAITLFYKALEHGKEKVNNVRLIVVGMFGVGKTSLVNNLIWEFRQKKQNNETRSTEGIAIHRCKLMTDGDWCLDTELKGVKFGGRIQNVVCNNNQISKNSLSETSANHETASRVTYTEDHETQTQTEPFQTFKERMDMHKGDEIVQHGIKVAKKMLASTIDNSEKSKASLDESKNEITVSVWDFAGQTLYYSTHQFFLNERSIYVVVMDMTKSLQDVVSKSDGIGIWCGLVDSFTYLDIFKFWLNAIHMNSDYQSGERTIKPTVILVGTRKDNMKGSAEEKEKNMNLYFDNALCSFDKDSPIFNHIYKNRFLVNNLSPKDSAFAELRKEIVSLAAKQGYWDEEYPVRWIHMEQTLDKLRDEKRQIVTIQDLEKEDLENIHPLGKEELTSFLELQHKQGNIIFFNSGELKDIVVLAPQWIIEAFKCFIPHNQKIKATVLKDWEEYKKYAILKPNVLYEVMKNSPPYIHEYQSVVLNYMEYLNVIAKPLTSEEDLTGIPLDFHIVPCLLSRAPPPLHSFTSPPDKPQTPVLAFVFCGKFLPPSFFHRLVAVCIRAWPISQERDQYCLFNGLAIFTLNETITLRIWYIDYIIYARIVCCSENEKLDDFIWLFQEVRRKLKRSLLEFVRQSSSVFEECIQCPDLKVSLHNKGLFLVNQFKYKKAIACPVCNPHAVTRSNAMKHWFKQRLARIETDDE